MFGIVFGRNERNRKEINMSSAGRRRARGWTRGAALACYWALLARGVLGFSDVGRWDVALRGERCALDLPKSLFKGAQIFVILTCETNAPVNVTVLSSLYQASCSSAYYHFFDKTEEQCRDGGDSILDFRNDSYRPNFYSDTKLCMHKQPIVLEGRIIDSENGQSLKKKPHNPAELAQKPLFTIPKDGIYVYSLGVKVSKDVNVTAHIEMQSAHGYLSAGIWPLLPFFGLMCGVYSLLCTGWLLVCWSQWRDLLRIQFWIGGVALLGMLESATYYAVYSSINRTGLFNAEAYIFAEWVSVAKRALARMLVIIVSLGFGIVKPRLGPALQRVTGTGALWGVLAAIEAWLKLHHKQKDSNKDLLLSQAPLALLDSAICWWVFVSLSHTMRTLRLRRNTVKLSLYRHFTNTLIFAVVSSVVFMLYSIKMYRFQQCITDWKEVWVDEGYWHILFASVLTVIMVLWRPTNNNQRYAFTPLLDNADDEDDEEEQFVNDAYGVKMRGTGGGGGGDMSEGSVGTAANGGGDPASAALLDDDLRWVEEHIPASALPVLDSDEEIINTKFEVSKMQ